MTKTSLVVKSCSLLMAVVLLFTLLSATAVQAIPAQAQGGNGKKADVASAAQLEKALKNEVEFIRVTADFELDRTFYVSGISNIYSDKAVTLTRSPSFGGDLFVVGEDAKGSNALLNGTNAVLTLGDPDSDTPDLLTIDGNKDAMSTAVNGTILFVCNSSVVNMYDNTSIVNAHKVSNKKALTGAYSLSYENRIGGAAAIIAQGTLNVYGGAFRRNSVNDENADDGAPESERDSTYGGAIFNYSNVKVFGGVFEDNYAARGGAIYNYRTLKIEEGVFRNNTVQTHGGAVYQAGSQYAQTHIGFRSTEAGEGVLFADNNAGKNGGAIYTYTHSSLVIYGNTAFKANHANGGGGGAICTYSGAQVNYATFEQNTASTRGAGMYISNTSDDLTTRISHVSHSVFRDNEATNGAAITLFASTASLREGAKAVVDQCEFIGNRAVTPATETTETEFVGGAMYISRKSTLHMSGSSFKENTAENEGGAIYLTGSSTADIIDTSFEANTVTDKGGYGGAITVRSSVLNIDGSAFTDNTSPKNGGALYVAYVGENKKDADVHITDSQFSGNVAQSYGGAIYSTTHIDDSDAIVLDVRASSFNANEALKGGAMYLTAGTDAYMKDITVEGNTNTAIEHDTAKDFNGGAVYLSESTVEINGASFTGNSAAYNGGGIGLYSASKAVLNNITADGNTAKNAGGFLYNSGSDCKLYNSTLSGNASDKNGGALSLHSEGTTAVYNTVFDGNTADTNGGAAYVYTGVSDTLMQDCTFTDNTAGSYGGAVYASNESQLALYDIVARGNHAKNGGVLYETTTGTVVTLNGLTVSGNTATSGPIIYGNTTKSNLYINKSNYTDEDLGNAPDADYWTSAIANKLTVEDIATAVPTYTPYTDEQPQESSAPAKKPVSVQDVLSLGKKSSDAAINDVYGAFKKQDNSSNFMSRNTTRFENINGKTVSVDTFVYYPYHKANNTNVGEGLLIYQALLYKQAHPDEEVYIDISSFRFSIEAAVNINRNSRYFGYMRNLVGQDYDEYGFVRLSYLLITAAKMGIHVTAIGQMDAYPISSADPNLEEYFTEQLSDPCDPHYVKNGVIGDYLTFRYCYWTSYDDNDATDMMHTKLCAVSHYLDMNGVAHTDAVWSSSANLDGVQSNGQNGNSKLQTASIVSDHEEIYRASANYLRLIAQYCEQEDVYAFRNLVNERTTEQVERMLAGEGDSIPENEKIVYIGSKTDDVFELYFAPFGGDSVVWDETYNPYCKYLRKLYDSDDYILFTWNNANYNSFGLGKQMELFISEAFHKNPDPRNKIYVNLEAYDTSVFDDMTLGKDIGLMSFNQKDYGAIHSKDLQVSYGENGQRHYVTLLNSMNIHGGSMYYQSNFMLVINETKCDTNSVFYTIADMTTVGITDSLATEADSLGRPFTKDQSVTIGDLSAAPYTIEAVVQVPKSVTDRAGVIVGNYDNSNKTQLNLELYNGGKVRLFFYNGTQKVSHIFQKDIRSDAATHIAVTISDKTAVLYVNGKKTETATLSASYRGAQKGFMIGGDHREGNTCFFKGTIYEVNLFNDVRTAAEIQSDAIAVPGNASGLIYGAHFTTNDPVYTPVQLDGRTFSAKKYYAVNTLPASPYTIEAVVQVPKSVTGRAGVIVGNYNNGTKNQLNLEIYSGGKVRLFFFNGAKKVTHVFDKDIRSDAPTHIAVTMSGKSASLYVDGVLSETATLASAYKGATHIFRIGGDRRGGNTQYFRGTIYSVTMFKDVRTAAEIAKDRLWVDGNASGLLYARRFATDKTYTAAQIVGRQFRSQTAYALDELSATPYTIEATLNVPTSVSGRAGVVVGNYNNSSKPQLNLEIYEGGRVRLFFHNGKQKVTCLFTKDIRSDAATHIAVTVKGKTATLYVNGKKAEAKTLSATYQAITENFKIGGDNRPTNNQYFRGTIYSVSLFSDVRTAKEIAKDAAFVSASAPSLLYTGHFTATAPTYNTVNLTGASFSALKSTAVPSLSAAPKTVEAVISLPKTVTGRGGVIVGNYNNGLGKQLNLEVYDGGRVRLFFFDGNYKVTHLFKQDIRSSAPTHIAVTLNGNRATLYVNGEVSETASLTYAYAGSADHYIIGGDRRKGNTCFFKGTIYEVSLFGDVRTAAQIKQDMIGVDANEASLLYAGSFLA